MNVQKEQADFSDSEVVIALVGAVGTDLTQISERIAAKMDDYDYAVEHIRVSEQVIPTFIGELPPTQSEYDRVKSRMDAGDRCRVLAKDSAILAKGVASWIAALRAGHGNGLRRRMAYIVRSLKHPQEVYRLRQIYPRGFYLIGVHSSRIRREDQLINRKGMSRDDAEKLIGRDADDEAKHGQHTTDTFEMCDFFLNADDEVPALDGAIDRALKLLFGHPHTTPTFDEFAMFLAFASSLRSADLSRQVGAVIAKENEILAVGANDCPRAGGGLYWPEKDVDGVVRDAEGGRDYVRGYDANKRQQASIIEAICREAGSLITDPAKFRELLTESPIADLTEYGRAVHAEMEALSACSRRGANAKDATLFCTTFPCHNCAKHLIAAGIRRVVYVEPYPKSKTFELHPDAVTTDTKQTGRVLFEPFVGVSPRRFFDLFSMNLGAGWRLTRKDKRTGAAIEWNENEAKLRVQMIPGSYLDLEAIARLDFEDARKSTLGEVNHG